MARRFEIIDPNRDTGQQTICNTLRKLWRHVDDPAAREMIADCYDYAKRMDEKLRVYKAAMEPRYERGPGHSGPLSISPPSKK